ncbi:MAG: T9SS type A sorting domain-containing protein [Chitinophagales bacterium]|nr:T9SS type A sorting domain-containing protein [Chitinophagales bacterium]
MHALPRILLFNTLGIKFQAAAITQTNIVVDVSKLSKGIYSIAVKSVQKAMVKKMVIE